MAVFSFIFMFSLVLGVSMVVHGNRASKINAANCTVSEIRRTYSQQIYNELENDLESCTSYRDANFTIRIGNKTLINDSDGFLESDFPSNDTLEIVDSIFHLAKQMPMNRPVTSTINRLKHCTTHINKVAMKVKPKDRRKRNVFDETACLQTMSLSELWRIFRAHPRLKDRARPHHSKTR